MDITALHPSEPLKTMPERVKADLHVGIVLGLHCQHSNAPHPLGLLRARRERPRSRAAKQPDELAPLHSITSSAVASSLSGTVRPSILAVEALITSSNLLDCTTGK